MKRKRTTITPAMEQRVVEMLKLGMHKSSIIKEVGISTTSVGRVIKRNASSIPPELKSNIAKLVDEGKENKEIAALLNIPSQMVANCKNYYRMKCPAKLIHNLSPAQKAVITRTNTPIKKATSDTLNLTVGSILITISRTMNGKVHIAPDGIYINY